MKFTQKRILEKLIPSLKNEGSIYQKQKKIKARKTVPGELIYTVTSDGIETQNTANPGDMLVENQTDSLEKYLVKKEKFLERYVWDSNIDHEWAWYQAIGKVSALIVDQRILDLLNQPDPFSFESPWGTDMIVKMNDYLVSPLDFTEIYRVAKKEFSETYQPV